LDSSTIVTIVLMGGGIIGFILSLFGLKRSGRKKLEGLRDHLHMIGVKAWTDDFSYQGEEKGKKRYSTKKHLGTIILDGKEINSIIVTGVASQYGVNYFLDFTVPHTSKSDNGKSKVKLAMKKIKDRFSNMKTADISWKGDMVLVQKLDADSRLKDKILRTDLKPVRYSIELVPDQKESYYRIRTPYFLPATDIFEVLNLIAKHMKTW
jgi:hypothetical protein